VNRKLAKYSDISATCILPAIATWHEQRQRVLERSGWSLLSISIRSASAASGDHCGTSFLWQCISISVVIQRFNAILIGALISFLSDLGRIFTGVSEDPRETIRKHLFQKVSLAVQCYNSVAFRGTFLFSVPTELE